MFPGRAVPFRNAALRDGSGTLGAHMNLGDQVRRRLDQGPKSTISSSSERHHCLIFDM